MEIDMPPSDIVAEATTLPLHSLDMEIENCVIQEAISYLEKRLFRRGPTLATPADVGRYLQLQLIAEKNEVIGLLFLDARLRVIAFERVATGSIREAAIHPRIILGRTLDHNASGVVVAHNHPSGDPTPSEADKDWTRRIQALLAAIDVTVVDHFIVGRNEPYSFKKAGLI
jgi:DNA repair protein RadC